MMYQTENVAKLHRGNPLIEALPAPILDRIELAKSLSRGPRTTLKTLMEDPPKLRVHNLVALKTLFLAKPECLDIAEAMDLALREFYVPKNPMSPEGQAYRYGLAANGGSEPQEFADTELGCMFVVGESGMGKTTTIRIALQRYPQVIRHSAYMEIELPITQVVWLSVEAPTGGSTVTLQHSILEALDKALGLTGTKYAHAPKSTKSLERDKLTSLVVQLLRTYAVGLIHIDDVQSFCGSTAGKKALRRFLVRLTNLVQVPIILAGTPESLDFFAGSFEVARRACSLGAFELERPEGPEDPIFDALVKYLFTFHLVETPLTVDAHTLRVLYELSKGVTSVLRTLHVEAQKIALRAAKAGPAKLELRHYKEAHELLLTLHGQLDELDGTATKLGSKRRK
ncbi:AAA family ATPase [Rhizobacter sp. P5_C2]